MDTDVSREESLNKLLAELGNARIHFDKSQKEEFRKCMLSSSVNPKHMAAAIEFVCGEQAEIAKEGT